jgi:membrane-bound lytic murein transglycosylase D
MRFPFNCFILTLLTMISVNSFAQISVKNSPDTLHNEVKKQLESLVMPEGLDMSFNGLLNQWYEKKNINTSFTEDSVNPYVADSTVIKRLSKLPTIMELPFNEHVRKCIDFYTGQRRKQVSYMLAMGQYYLPIFEDQLIANKLPNELKYLPIIESALNPTAYSRAGAGGLWQLMVSTGRIYGLQVNSLIDERMDPYKATIAAARYLKDLYRIYGDWNLVIAAYNCGPGNVNKAIRRSGGKRDYWQIYPYLPGETRNYVPIFIAANYVMNYYKEHNLNAAPVCLPMSDTIIVKEKVHLMQIADLMNLPIAELRTLNPQYRQDVVPGNFAPCAIRLPLDAASSFLQNKDKIVAYRAGELFTNRLLVEPSEKIYSSSSRHKVKGSKSHRRGGAAVHSSSSKKKSGKSSGAKRKKHR